MIDGEGTHDASAEIASPGSISGLSPKSDASGAAPSLSPSQYSSCEELDAERYSSANSVMDTPSLCSSLGTFHECLDSEPGSLKNFGPGVISGLEDLSSRCSFVGSQIDNRVSSLDWFDSLRYHNAKRNVDYGSGASIGSLINEGSSQNAAVSIGGGVSLPMVGNGSKMPVVGNLNSILDDFVYREDGNGNSMPWKGQCKSETSHSAAQTVSHKDIDEVIVESDSLGHGSDSGFHDKFGSEMVAEPVENGFDELNTMSVLPYDEKEAGGLSSGDGLSSLHEHSDGEDSMYNYGTDDEHKYHGKNTHYGQDVKCQNDSPLAMNSSIAFGSNDWDDFVLQTGDNDLASAMLNNVWEQKQEHLETELNLKNATFLTSGESIIEKDEIGIHQLKNQANLADESDNESCPMDKFSESSKLEHGSAMNEPQITGQLGVVDDCTEYLESCDVSNIFETKLDPLRQKAHSELGLDVMDAGHQNERPKEIVVSDGQVSESLFLGKSPSQLDPLSKAVDDQVSNPNEAHENDQVKLIGNFKENLLPLTSDCNINKQIELEDSHKSADFFEDSTTPSKTEDLELNPFYDEVVDDMEEILLDVNRSPGHFQSQLSMSSRDGGSTASTSGKGNANSQQNAQRIDAVEVVGASQKKGDVSLGERLVGVKEYTVYKIRAWCGNDQWEVEHRYRDFLNLYHRLKSFYVDQGWILPSPWSSIERESRKIFGASSPDVVAQRSTLIEECLQSILHTRAATNLPSALTWFLSPPKALPDSPLSNPSFTFLKASADGETVAPYGKTISLVVEIRPHKSTRQMLEAQHYTCGGCHKYFDDGNSRIYEFVRAFGWGKPRLCEYTGQLFCFSCHKNDAAVLPARVLNHWDFTQYPVSQLAKSYLDSIHDQPMLCVSAVNPLLFSKVPTLLRVMDARRKIAVMLPNVRCPFRRSVDKGLGSRRYLLESNDFFALRDLIDLSKGAFAALPVMIETISLKILQHITEHCLICCDVGVPCDARHACEDPSSLIFPFQEGVAEKCLSCDSVFHKPCFRKLTSCGCGSQLNPNETVVPRNEARKTNSHGEGTSEHNFMSAAGFLSGLFSRARQEKTVGAKDGDGNVISMGHLPGTSL